MTDAPDPSQFTFVDFPDEYEVRFKVIGEVRRRIKAESPEVAKAEAQELAEDMADDDGLGFELDDVETIEVQSVFQRPRMYRVRRNGIDYQVNRLKPGDQPREPKDDGF